MGQLKFLELRERARRKLGSNFKIRTFHDEMLSGGSLPLDLLETRTDKWIAQQRSKWWDKSPRAAALAGG